MSLGVRLQPNCLLCCGESSVPYHTIDCIEVPSVVPVPPFSLTHIRRRPTNLTASPQLQAYRFNPATVSDLQSSLIRLEEVWTLPKVNDCVETDAHVCSMRLINVKAFLERESLIRKRKREDRRAKVLEFGDDEATEYAILSHRWVEQEVDYDEMVGLAKMATEERDEIRRRDGYQKILQSCEQAQKDGYEWLWADTCCIDKRSSAELSEAINSMYRWYENAKVCYAYLHDVTDLRFPTWRDQMRYPDCNGWPEWFSRGWTLQELIAPSDVQFFDNNWRSIGDKRTHAPTLEAITGIPVHILIHGLHGNRPCVAQIMSWAAHRKTTRVEDRAYSLMGLLDVNMPMLYGEGKKAFHRLQLEIIRASNDQSIFAWSLKRINMQPGSILADDPSFFEDCGGMELMGHDEFIRYFRKDVPEEDIEDRLGTFLVTNRGIQISLFFRPFPASHSLFEVQLPCRDGRRAPPVTIALTLWESNYYRCPTPHFGLLPPEGPPQLCQVYLRYQDLSHYNITFKIDDSTLTENGFTFCETYPERFTGNALTLTSTDPLCVKAYFDRQANYGFSVGLGQCFGKGWIHVGSVESNVIRLPPWEFYPSGEYIEMLARMPEHAQHMNKAFSGAERYGRICIMQARLPQTTTILQISSVMWKSSKMCGVKLGVFDDPGFCDVSGKWTAFDVDVGSFFARLIGTDITIYLGNRRSRL